MLASQPHRGQQGEDGGSAPPFGLLQCPRARRFGWALPLRSAPGSAVGAEPDGAAPRKCCCSECLEKSGGQGWEMPHRLLEIAWAWALVAPLGRRDRQGAGKWPCRERVTVWKRNPPQQQPLAPVVAGDVLVLLGVQVYFIFPVKRKACI